MKKIIILLICFIAVCSCKKSYKCTCTYQGQEVAVERGDYTRFGKWRKEDAEKECQRMQNEGPWLVKPVVCEFQ